jgi:hypothetical protein
MSQFFPKLFFVAKKSIIILSFLKFEFHPDSFMKDFLKTVYESLIIQVDSLAPLFYEHFHEFHKSVHYYD